nr:MAG TPA: ATPase [Caudoviricetes sp.]
MISHLHSKKQMNIEVIIVIAIVAGLLGRAAFRAWRERR